MMIFLNTVFIVGAIFLLKNRIPKYDSYVNHLSIFSGVWIVITIGSQLSYGDFVSPESVLLFYACLYCYILGSSILSFAKFKESSMQEYNIGRIRVIVFLLVVLCIIANWDIIDEVFFNFRSILDLAIMRQKKEYSQLDESNIFKAIFQRAYLIYIPLTMFLYKKKKAHLVFLILAIISGILLSLSKFTRGPFMHVLLVTGIVYTYLYRKKISIKLVVIIVSSVFLIFGITTSFLFEASGNFKGSILESTQIYIFGGQLSFQDIMYGRYVDNRFYDSPYYSLDNINYILERFEIIDTYPNYVRNWSTTHIFTNTYTYLDCYYLDFGLPGVLIGSCFSGFISDSAYYAMKKYRYNIYNIIFYGYVCFYNMIIFSNNEFMKFSSLLPMVILLVINFFSKNVSGKDDQNSILLQN
ncbi:MAG: oligosaccharide repeat unit polymerase [Flavobacteriaceae bacterium]|nr:oligosaccharide repeat unit polymerase [Flavobacteriaceae bacterium]